MLNPLSIPRLALDSDFQASRNVHVLLESVMCELYLIGHPFIMFTNNRVIREVFVENTL